jgi:peptide chain release factor 1
MPSMYVPNPYTTLDQQPDPSNLQSLAELQALLSDPTSDAELRSLASIDITTTTNTLAQLTTTLKRSLTPPHPFAHLPCLVELHPGAGGSEASLFAASLLNMYTGLCARRAWPWTLLSYSADDSVPANETGLTDCVVEIDAPGAYDLLRTEAGVHRVQRVPATEKKGRTHTSAVSVLVLPSLPKPGEDSALNFDQ